MEEKKRDSQLNEVKWLFIEFNCSRIELALAERPTIATPKTGAKQRTVEGGGILWRRKIRVEKGEMTADCLK